MNNIIQEKIKKEAEGYGKLAPVFIEGADFALNNQWISVDDDLPYNHNELIRSKEVNEGTETVEVFAVNEYGDIWDDYMIYKDGKWRWNDFKPAYWMTAPELPKE